MFLVNSISCALFGTDWTSSSAFCMMSVFCWARVEYLIIS
jgi:hypothetical protein